MKLSGWRTHERGDCKDVTEQEPLYFCLDKLHQLWPRKRRLLCYNSLVISVAWEVEERESSSLEDQVNLTLYKKTPQQT